ncbi:MAG: lactate utilization protein [Oscillospiraceae bacterium]|nr:lactate utilization protein [Oscillospiraceae bacterium]
MPIDNRIERVMAALKLNKMKPFYVENCDQLKIVVRELIKKDKLITIGGSVTLRESGVTQMLEEEYAEAFLDRSAAQDREEVEEIMRAAFNSDTFITSTNALTEEGELYNVDGNGNRVSAMIFGPRQVIVVAGVNKIVKDMEEAVRRVETIAAPKNTVRLECDTPCARTGKCAHCHSDSRICCSYVRLAQQRVPNRIKVIIVNQELGY